MLHTKFVKIGLRVPEKILNSFVSVYGRGGHLGRVTSIMLIFILFSCTQKLTYIQNLIKADQRF